MSWLVVGVLLAMGAESDRPFSYANVELVIFRFARRGDEDIILSSVAAVCHPSDKRAAAARCEFNEEFRWE